MGESVPHQPDGERVSRQQRSQQKGDQRGARNNPKSQNGNGQEKDYRHSKGYNERPDRKSSQHRHRERDKYHEERSERGHHDDIGSWHHDRERYYEERATNRDKSERRPNQYEKSEHDHKEREHGKSQQEKTPNRYDVRHNSHMDSESSWKQDDRINNRYKERERPKNDRESYRNQGDNQENYRERDWHHKDYLYSIDKTQRHPMDVSDKEPYFKAERSFAPNGSQINDVEYYDTESDGGILNCHKCRYLCTGRAFCQMVEALLNMLILICCSVSYNSTGGFTGITNLGGIYYYQFGGAYSGFSGADGEKAQQLDVQFYQLKLPTVTASMAFGGALMAFSCLLLLLGVLRVPWRLPVLLLVECVLDIAISVGYIPALYFYITKLQQAYDSQVCKDRESLYSSKGYQGFTCSLHGADIAAALFACMAIIAFILSAVLAVKGFIRVRRIKKKPQTSLDF
ncbi:MARVEL domain-containing protein 3 isoform X1 [Pelobates fuscus]|uniref:MARVEL domain-containing protein 3 isoform X1 n=1 Tax=Pelobates fuscus TaxID=191477 RepID=UPI002FE463C4